MQQFIPDVSESDIERVLLRDFADSYDELEPIVREVHIEPRVIMACFKKAQGDAKKLKEILQDAAGYYRELIAEAEYPNYSKKSSKLSPSEVNKIIEKDKQQYLDWFNKA